MNKNFFRTKEGGLTISFIIIMISFFVIQTGLKMEGDAVSIAGLVLILAAMLYSPVKVFVIDRKKKKASGVRKGKEEL